ESADPAMQGRVRELTEALEADERDRVLVARVDHIRLEQSTVDVVRSDFKRWESFPELKKALEDYGLRGGGPGPAAAVIGRRPGPVRQKLVGALDFCLHNAVTEEARVRGWLTAVLAGVDGDPWRIRVRRAVAEGNRPALVRLAREAEAG